MSDPTSDPQSIEDELDAALAALDSTPLPTTTLPEQASGDPTPLAFTTEPSTGSQTLDALDESRCPKVSTVCEHCPNSVWFESPAEVKCYCRVMFLVTWTQQATQPDHQLRRDVSRPGAVVGQAPAGVIAADKYIAEREAKRRLNGSDIPNHVRYTSNDGVLSFAGIRNIDGQALALLSRDN